MAAMAWCTLMNEKWEVSVEDEFLHFPPLSGNPLWVESYFFNGYDPREEMGITIYKGFNPASRIVLETVALHSRNPLFFGNIRSSEKDEPVLESGNVAIKLSIPLTKWRIQMKNLFQKVEEGHLSTGSDETELDLSFDSVTQAHGFSTNRGNRYEQTGFLIGRVRIGEKCVNFEGRGIRDHSWEIRNILTWGKFLWLMGCLNSGEALSLTFMRVDEEPLCHGWFLRDVYDEIQRVEVDHEFPEASSGEVTTSIETSRYELEIRLRVLSCLVIPVDLMSFVSLPATSKKKEVVENLVEINRGQGYGFLWYGV
jgi:hypothetical protein